jgi:hypothetical protein
MSPIILDSTLEVIDTDDLIVEYYELASYMKADCDDAASVEALEIISGAQSELESHLGRPITPRDFVDTIDVPSADAAWVDGNLYRPANLYFPRTPVHAIDYLKADGVTQDLTDQQITTWGIRGYSGSVGKLGTVLVSYRAGIDGRAPEHTVLKTLVKRRAAREMIARADNAQGAESINDEGYSVKYVAADGGYTAAELRSVRSYHRRVVSV